MTERREIVLPTNVPRIHVRNPEGWGHDIGTDYHVFFGEADIATGGGKDLVAHGWETSGFGYLAGSLAGFMDPSDPGTPGGLNFDVAGDYLISPFIFGDYTHALAVSEFLGYIPTVLEVEIYGYFASVAADEEATGFGLIEAGSGGNVLAKADLMAFISVGATNFELHSGAAADEGSAKDTNPHLFRITVTKGSTVEWFIDNVSQGTIAIQADLWPAAIAANTQAGGNNDPVLSWIHARYS